jgi:hypothetical protein
MTQGATFPKSTKRRSQTQFNNPRTNSTVNNDGAVDMLMIRKYLKLLKPKFNHYCLTLPPHETVLREIMVYHGW